VDQAIALLKEIGGVGQCLGNFWAGAGAALGECRTQCLHSVAEHVWDFGALPVICLRHRCKSFPSFALDAREELDAMSAPAIHVIARANVHLFGGQFDAFGDGHGPPLAGQR